MHYIPSNKIIKWQTAPMKNAAFAIESLPESTFNVVEICDTTKYKKWWACPTLLCGTAQNQYNPAFIMAVLSAEELHNLTLETLEKRPIPHVTFSTSIGVRRSMTLNAMRMSRELFDLGSERVFELAKNRLAARQTDVVHDLLVYLMHSLLDVRRNFMQERILRADSIAAYLGLSPSKVLPLLEISTTDSPDDITVFIHALQSGKAGIVKRKLDIPALVDQQLNLLKPYAMGARMQENYMMEVIKQILDIWRKYGGME